MYHNIGTCPRCQQSVAPERIQSFPVICDKCGNVLTASENVQHQGLERSLLGSAVIASVVILGALMYFGTWGGYSFEVIPLKVGDIMGSNSKSDIERYIQIAMDLRKLDLVEKQYRVLAQREPQYFAKLGKFQVTQHEYREATETFRQYFSIVKSDYEARIDYARALGEVGMVDDAIKNFDYVLASRPGVRQVTVIQYYVTMLVKAERFDQAKRVIDRVRAQDPTAARFMDTEYKVISARTGSRTS